MSVEATLAERGVWLPIAEADKTKTLDLLMCDDGGSRWRITDCQWKRGGRLGKSGWYFVDHAQWEPSWCPVQALEMFHVTHFMEVPEFPA